MIVFFFLSAAFIVSRVVKARTAAKAKRVAESKVVKAEDAPALVYIV